MDQYTLNRQNSSTMDHLPSGQRIERPAVYSQISKILDQQESRQQVLLTQTETVCASVKAQKAAILRRLNLRGSPKMTSPEDSYVTGKDVAHHQLESVQKGFEPFSTYTQPNIAPVRVFTATPAQGLPVITVKRNAVKSRLPVRIGTSMATFLPAPPPRNAVPEERNTAPVTASTAAPAPKPKLPSRIGTSRVTFKPTPPPRKAVTEERNTAPVTASTAAPAPKPKLPSRIGTSRATFKPTPPPRNAVTEKATLVPTPPSKPAPPQMAGNPRRHSFHPAKTIVGTKKPEAGCDIKLKELKPHVKPKESLPLSLSLISSLEWEDKIKGLKYIQALAQHDPHILQEKLHEVCQAVIPEVKNLRSCVGSEAIDTIVYLHVYLGKGMDKLAEDTGAALLQKIAQSSGSQFLQKKSTWALNALVQYCSPDPVLKVLLSSGLSHLSVAVRACAAEKLHMLADSLEASEIMEAKTSFTVNFVIAVNKMSVDAAADVRQHGLPILKEIAPEPAFKKVWLSVVHDKDRVHMEKILKKMGVQ